MQESLGKFPEVDKAYDGLLEALHSQLESTEVSINVEVEAVKSSIPSTGVINGELSAERDERAKQVLDRRNKELESMKGELGTVWIMLMRFARRAEGLKPARSVFARARKDKYCHWGVYEAAGEFLIPYILFIHAATSPYLQHLWSIIAPKLLTLRQKSLK